MKFSDKQKYTLLMKLRPWNEYRECVGYLLPIEVLYLVEQGCKPSHNDDWIVAKAREQVKRGDAFGHWFYFVPNKELLEKMRELNPAWIRHS